MKKQPVSMPLQNLKVDLFVRRELNQDRVIAFAELMENGVVFPPIMITPEAVVIDGRHRMMATDFLGRTDILVEVVEVENEVDLIAKAYNANAGGALPPTQADTEHTVTLLLERGESKKRIAELLNIPPGMARKYINEIQSKAARARLLRAAAAVTDGGLTVAKSAEQYNVDPDKLREVLSGNRQKHKQGVAEIQRGLTSQYKSLSQKNSAMLRRLIEKHEDGDVTKAQVLAIIEHLEQLQKRATRVITDWKKRFTNGSAVTTETPAESN